MVIVKRFLSRFESGITVKVKGVTFNNNKKMKQNFESLICDRKIIQLYHCTDSYDYLKRSKDIFDNGFIIGPSSIKGKGVYFASHSQYSAFWGGRNHVIVSDIIVDEDHVSRHISEIYSSNNNWEYVISYPKLIFPRCLIEFQCFTTPRSKYWSNAICDNCRSKNEKIEEFYRRCDCKHFPVADKFDIINYSK